MMHGHTNIKGSYVMLDYVIMYYVSYTAEG